ncbi:hypothetical protein [Nocardia sp. NPDC049526]|uniref:hypothetical protein n=1 Tax=Nocardia sp. NPDC049526 TaxID=3364316 RepID=UPI0037A89FF6
MRAVPDADARAVLRDYTVVGSMRRSADQVGAAQVRPGNPVAAPRTPNTIWTPQVKAQATRKSHYGRAPITMPELRSKALATR